MWFVKFWSSGSTVRPVIPHLATPHSPQVKNHCSRLSCWNGYWFLYYFMRLIALRLFSVRLRRHDSHLNRRFTKALFRQQDVRDYRSCPQFPAVPAKLIFNCAISILIIWLKFCEQICFAPLALDLACFLCSKRRRLWPRRRPRRRTARHSSKDRRAATQTGQRHIEAAYLFELGQCRRRAWKAMLGRAVSSEIAGMLFCSMLVENERRATNSSIGAWRSCAGDV